MKFFSKENAAKQALAQSILAVVTIDEKNNITFYNDAAQKLWGYTPNEVLGKNIKLLVPHEHKANHDNYVNSHRQTNVNKIVGSSREVELETKSGCEFGFSLLYLSLLLLERSTTPLLYGMSQKSESLVK